MSTSDRTEIIERVTAKYNARAKCSEYKYNAVKFDRDEQELFDKLVLLFKAGKIGHMRATNIFRATYPGRTARSMRDRFERAKRKQ